MTRPLVVRFGALGDMVLMTVAIRRIYERFGLPVDVLGSGNWTAPLLHGQLGVGDIHVLHSRKRPYWVGPDQWQLIRHLRTRGVGPTWLFDAQIEKPCWLLRRAGWGEADLLALDKLPDIAGEHFCDRWQRFAELSPESALTAPTTGAAATVRTDGAVPALSVSPALRTQVLAWLRSLGVEASRCILIQPGNQRTMRWGDRRRASNTKYWPEERWAALLRGLRALHADHALLLLGIGPEARINDEILALAKVANAHNLARSMTVPRLMALAELAFGMISVDTGPAHVGAALGCPVLTLFDSPSKLTMYAPRGPAALVSCIVGGIDAEPSMLGLTAEAVLASWRGLCLQQAVRRKRA